MLEFRPENFRHACESGDQEAQLYAFWAHSRTGAGHCLGPPRGAQALPRILNSCADWCHHQEHYWPKIKEDPMQALLKWLKKDSTPGILLGLATLMAMAMENSARNQPNSAAMGIWNKPKCLPLRTAS